MEALISDFELTRDFRGVSAFPGLILLFNSFANSFFDILIVFRYYPVVWCLVEVNQ
ncbi:hypothetical protein BJX63DRAFT_384344 [Aspergillus granulosus]|uniref:Uncharacterized protein n=1 Tax=Aspergillus granulosus TaxID=176169 RepID=A0ABR4HRB1_9EURO